MAESGNGPLGSETNPGDVDSGTLAVAQHTASAPIGSCDPQKIDYFDVARLLPVLEAQSWTVGKAFMQFWIDGNACTAKNDPKLKKATISANASQKCVRSYPISWDWLLGFKEAKDAYNTFVQDKLFNEAAVKQLIKTYGNRSGSFGDWLTERLKPAEIREHFAEHQIQKHQVEVERDITKLTDLTAALADFGFFAMYRGTNLPYTVFKEQMPRLRSILASSGLLPGNVALKSNDEVAQWLAERYLAVMIVSDVGVFAADIYEFNGFQYLGNWDLETKTVWGGKAWAIDAWLMDDVRYGRRRQIINVENATFRRYREATCKGGDFMALTSIKMLPRSRAILIPK